MDKTQGEQGAQGEFNTQLNRSVDEILANNNFPQDIVRFLFEKNPELLSKASMLGVPQNEWLNVLDSISDPIFIHDSDNRIIRANRSYAEKADTDVQQLIGKTYWHVFPKLDAPPQGCVESVERTEERLEELQLSSGEVYAAHYHPIVGIDGSYYYSLQVLEDITEQSPISEEQRNLSTAMQHLVAESVLLLDVDGMICYANEAFFKLFGYKKDEIIGRHISVLDVPEQEDCMRPTEVLKRLRQHGHCRQEVYRLAKDGSAIPILLIASLLYDLQGVIIGYAGSYLNLQDIREAESNNKLLKSLIDQSRDALEVIEPNTGQILDVNKTACDTLGYSREELLSMTVYDINPDIDPDVDSDLKKSIVEGLQECGTAVFESRHQCKDGSIFPVELSLKQAQIGGKSFVMSVVRDITVRKQREKLMSHTLRAQRALCVCNTILIHAKDEEDLLARMCRTIVGEPDYLFAWIGYIDGNKKQLPQLVSCAHHDMPCFVEGEGKCLCDTACMGDLWAPDLHLDANLVVQNILDNPQYSARHEYARQNEFQSYVGLRLKGEDGAIFGMLNIYSREADTFTEKEVELLENLAKDLAFGIINLRTKKERDRLQLEHMKSVGRLKVSLIGTIQAIGNTAEKRDPYTAGHQSRVADLSEAIAKKLGLSLDIIEGIKLGSSIHDIGKIYVPAEILSRPSRLTTAEFEIIKSHSKVGYDLIKDIRFPWPVAEMVLQHHERMDGSGYPEGLKGEEINIEARILAVADVVEAITADRPYRAARSVDEALSEIEANRGRLYDSSVVDACLKLFRRDGYQISSSELD